jgi:hypothetical protein
MMLLASAGGNRVPVSAQLLQADEETVRDVIHRCNEVGLACLASQGGRPRLQRNTVELCITASRSGAAWPCEPTNSPSPDQVALHLAAILMWTRR